MDGYFSSGRCRTPLRKTLRPRMEQPPYGQSQQGSYIEIYPYFMVNSVMYFLPDISLSRKQRKKDFLPQNSLTLKINIGFYRTENSKDMNNKGFDYKVSQKRRCYGK